MLLLRIPVAAQKDESLIGFVKETGERVSLVDGNKLYAWCQDAQDTFRIDSNNAINIRPGSDHSLISAASCWAYIEGVVDGTPTGKEFSPGENVRLSQYVDVVFAFLKTHPQVRDKMGVVLVQTALCEAFHK
jgi:hypothetical protein